MKAMPMPLVPQPPQDQLQANKKDSFWYVGSEPTSVLDTTRSPSPSSTLSSSHGSGGGGGGTPAPATTAAVPDAASEKYGGQGLEMEDWESDQSSILKLIMGDFDQNPSLNKILLQTASNQELDFNSGFDVVAQGSGFKQVNDPSVLGSVINQDPNTNPNPNPNLLSSMFQQQEQVTEVRFNQNPQELAVSQFVHNPGIVMPVSYPQLPSPAKQPKVDFSDPRSEFLFHQHQQLQQISMLHQQQNPSAAAAAMMKQWIVNDEMANQQLQQAIINAICQAAELIETGNPVLAQGILARLNHQLSLPTGKPYQRAAFYFKEALQLLLHSSGNLNTDSNVSPCNLIYKVAAYKSFFEISPVLQFANFTCNQALLEAFEGCNRIHIIDFDIGYGSQWASLMQELASRSGGAPSIKITAFASALHTDIELSFTQENLKIFARDINVPLELDILSLECLNSSSWPILHVSEKETIGVNLPISPFSNYTAALPLVLRFIKHQSPKIVVSLDRGCDRTDLPFAQHINHSIQCYSCLLESLDAANTNTDTVQKIERFWIQPNIEKIVLGHNLSAGRTLNLKTLFLQCGFTPLTFSNFTEAQAECLVQRTLVRSFCVERKQSSLALLWQQKELISASAWRC